MNSNLQIIDGATLMGRPLEKLNFVIDPILPQGLHILAGAPKIGKSWLVLWLCLLVTKGENVWNYQTTQGETLYLCLEDNERRIQNRLFDLTDDAPSEIRFAVSAGGIGTGLEMQIENFMKQYPQTTLIVIDTLQKIRGAGSDNAYASDYKDIGVLKELADKHHIAILLVHHLRKQKDDDPMNMISGTTGITGAVDGNYILEKTNRGSNSATLYCTGRDIEYRELQLEFEKENHSWKLLSDSIVEPEHFMDETIQIVSAFLKEHLTFSGTATELVEKLQPYSNEIFTPSVLSKRLMQNYHELKALGIVHDARRSSGKRVIELSYECQQ